MSRQELLFRLLEKAEKGNQYVYAHFNEMAQPFSPPPIIKRMQILPMGSGKIQGPNSKNKDEPFFEKHMNSNARRVFVLQKVKSVEKSLENEREQPLNNYLSQPNDIINKQSVLFLSSIANSTEKIDDASIQNARTQAESPIRRGYTTKRSFCATDPIKTTPRTTKEISFTRTEKSCIFKSTQNRMQSARIQSQHTFRSKNNSAKPVISTSQTPTLKAKDEQKRTKMLLRKEINKSYQRAFEPPPKISAKSYIVYQILQQTPKQDKKINIKIHSAFNSKVRVEIASLTKIMTCILAIQICQRLSLQAKKQQIKIGKLESSIGGTTARIQMDDIYTLHDLLHGLMLPSGNDASVAIAVWGGKRLIQQKQASEGQYGRKKMKKQCYDRFIKQMNSKAAELEMTKTNYANSHGLVSLLNRSCAHDIAVLSHYCMKNQYFRTIVGCRKYQTSIRVQSKVKIQKIESKIDVVEEEKKDKTSPKVMNDEDQQFSDVDSQTCSQVSHKNQKQKEDEKQNITIQQKIIVSQREISWQNTHKLLHKNPNEYLGIKTGVTTAAGPCLSSCIQTEGGRKIFIVVLNCKKLNMRFKQTEALKKWVYKKEGLRKYTKKSLSSNNQLEAQSQIANSENESQSLEELQSTNDPYD